MTRNTRATAAGLALALALGAGAARPLHAQGFFYVETEKAGRIYVFNNMKDYESWKKSGELGKAITRPGSGPNGETMVFDSEEAIHLYNFKHGNPGEVLIKPEEKKPTMKFAWKDGKTTFESDNASLSISNRVQFRYTVVEPDGGDKKGSFRIPRAKTKFEGWFYNKWTTYEMQLNWPDANPGGVGPLERAWINYDFSKGNKTFMVIGGQFKVPFGRQRLTSSGSQQFVDRSAVSGQFENAEQPGVQVWGELGKHQIEWRAGVFNGNGKNQAANDNTKYQFDARIQYQPWGDVKLSESDLESKDKPLLALAFNVESNDLRNVDPAVDEVKRTIYGGDWSFKYRGFSTVGAAYHKRNKPEVAPSFDTDGWFLQAGYFLYKRNLEAALRYGTYDPTDLKSHDDRKETGVAINYFWNKHPLKLQGDWRQLEDKAKKTKDHEVRVQTQFIF